MPEPLPPPWDDDIARLRGQVARAIHRLVERRLADRGDHDPVDLITSVQAAGVVACALPSADPRYGRPQAGDPRFSISFGPGTAMMRVPSVRSSLSESPVEQAVLDRARELPAPTHVFVLGHCSHSGNPGWPPRQKPAAYGW
jgi:hypothetical protein